MSDAGPLLDKLRPLLSGNAREFFAIRSGRRLRWIIPSDRHRLAVVLTSWRPYGLKTTLAWQGLSRALSMVGPAKLGLERLGATAGTDLDQAIGGWVNGRDLVPVVYVGTEGPSQKLVCHLTDTDGRVVAVARVPIGPDAQDGIDNDRRALAALANSPIGPFIPRLLLQDGVDRYGFQSVLPGRPASRRLTDAHTETLLLLHKTGEVSLRTRVERMLTRMAELGVAPELNRQAQEWTSRIPQDLSVPSPWQHGDFVPWNLRVENGRVHVLDWEDAIPAGLPVWDIAHFHIQQAFLFGKTADVLSAVEKSAGYGKYLSTFRIAPATGRLLIAAYCLGYGLEMSAKGNAEHARFLLQLFGNATTAGWA